MGRGGCECFNGYQVHHRPNPDPRRGRLRGWARLATDRAHLLQGTRIHGAADRCGSDPTGDICDVRGGNEAGCRRHPGGLSGRGCAQDGHEGVGPACTGVPGGISTRAGCCAARPKRAGGPASGCASACAGRADTFGSICARCAAPEPSVRHHGFTRAVSDPDNCPGCRGFPAAPTRRFAPASAGINGAGGRQRRYAGPCRPAPECGPVCDCGPARHSG